MSGEVVEQVHIQALNAELQEKSAQLRETEATLHEKESAVRRAREEQALMRELQDINQLTLRKLKDDSRVSKFRISDDALQEIMALEDEIKLNRKKTLEYKKDIEFMQSNVVRLVESTKKEEEATATIKVATGYDGTGSYKNTIANVFKEHQKILADLEVSQNTSKTVTFSLTKRIEELTAQMELCKNIDEETTVAKSMLTQKESEMVRIEDERKSLTRITSRKEKLLTQLKPEDAYKAIKMHEGDKRALHAELLKAIDTKGGGDRSIRAQDARLRQLEARLQAINVFLKEAFEGEEDCQDHRPELQEGETGVSIDEFEEIQAALTKSRNLFKIYDDRLSKLDADVEINEKRVTVLHSAIVSRTNHAARDNNEKVKDRDNWMDQAEFMQEEFDMEYERLTAENEELRRMIEEFSQ